MSKPTLFVQGSLVISSKASQKERHELESALPIDYIMKFIGERLPLKRGIQSSHQFSCHGDKIILLKSGTASGKSTNVAPQIYQRFEGRIRGNIVMTETRRLNAKNITYDITKIKSYGSMKIGKNIGFQTGIEKRLPEEKGIIIMTIGVLLRQLSILSDDEIMRKYGCILIDEFHERSIEIDTVLFLLKGFLERNWKDVDCPIIILMSATFEKDLYMKYLSIPEENFIEVKGYSFPIEAIFPKHNIQLIYNYIIDILKEMDMNEKGDIIVFLPSQKEIKEMKSRIFELNDKNKTKSKDKAIFYPISLSSADVAKASEDYISIQKKIEKGKKVYLATPVAEIGYTIENLKYCFDSGYYLSVEFNTDFSANTSFSRGILKSSALQRKGRVGRKFAGIWYPCYTEKVFNSLSEIKLGDMMTSNIATTILSYICVHHKADIIDKKLVIENDEIIDFSKMDFIETPQISSLTYYIEFLQSVGALNCNCKPTIFGCIARKFSKINILNLRMIWLSHYYLANDSDVDILDIITIAAFAEIRRGELFTRQWKGIRSLLNEKKNEGIEIDSTIIDFISDVLVVDEFIEYLFIWQEFCDKIKANENIREWCGKIGVKYSGILDAISGRDEIIDAFLEIGIKIKTKDKPVFNLFTAIINSTDCNHVCQVKNIKAIKKCIYEAYKVNLVMYNNISKEYIYQKKQIPVKIDLQIQSQNKPKFLVCSNLFLTKRMDKYEFVASSPVSCLDGYI
jgi:HrpA-like RNA helicase